MRENNRKTFIKNENTDNKNGSAWNKAGTWEEKHFKKNQIEEFFNKTLKDSCKKFGDIFMIEKIGAYSGDVNKNFLK